MSEAEQINGYLNQEKIEPTDEQNKNVVGLGV